MPEWINFKKLGESLSFEAVIRHYGVEVRATRQGRHSGPCPLPGHPPRNDASPFSANLRDGVFHCSGCGAKGSVLEFAALMERVVPEDRERLRPIAVKLALQFEIPLDDGRRRQSSGPPVAVNAPLDFELKGLEDARPHLRKQGFTDETVRHFGLGIAARGLLKGRLVIPLHHDGRLVGYAGRAVEEPVDQARKYLFPTQRERNGVVHRFDKTRLLYNGCFIKGPVDDLVVVAGFTDVWWLHQHGWRNVVSTMGSACSDEQARRIAALTKPAGRVWLMPDGGSAGQRYAAAASPSIARHRFVRWVCLSERERPAGLPQARIRAYLGWN